MPEYIDRVPILQQLEKTKINAQTVFINSILEGLLKKAPVADVVEVVRCKDCKYAVVNEHHPNKPLVCGKTKMCGTTEPNWYCADGAKMDGKGDTDD